MRDGWEAVKLAQCLASLDVRAGRNGPDLVLSVTEKRGIIPQSSVFKNRIATADTSKYKVLEKYDIAYNPYLLWCGAIGQWKGESAGVVSPVYECFRVNGNHDPSFFGLLFESGALTPYFNSTAIGSIERRRRTTPHVFMNAMLSVPPLVEQRRIVDVVESVDNYIAALQARVDAARIARNAVLHELLNAGGDGWVETTLGDCLTRSIGGVWGGEPNSDEEDVLVVRSTEFSSSGVLYFETGVTRSIKKSQLASRELRHGDVLLEKSGGGPQQPVGRVVFVNEDIPNRSVCSNFIQLLTPDQTNAIPKYVFFLMWYWHTSNRTLQFQAQTTGIRNLRTPDYLAQDIELPPLVEQRRIVEIVSSMDDSVQATVQTIVEAKNLRSGLLSDLLSGEHEIPKSYDKLLGAA